MSHEQADAETGERDRLPKAALLALAMTGFTAILTETMPAGLLPQIAEGLGVTESLAGQTVTAYAAGSLVAAIPLTAATQGWRRRNVLLTAIVGFLIFNTVTALSGSLWLTLCARFLAGVAAGLAWGILAGYARRMVVDRLKGRALAIAMIGTPIALSLGVPAGTLLGGAMGWRSAFLVMSATTIVLIGLVVRVVPDFAGQPAHRRRSLGSVATTPGIPAILATIFAWMTAHNILYTYIAPFAALSGLQGRVGLLLLGFGIAALVGIGVTGVLVDRMLRRLVLTCLTAFATVALALGLMAAAPAVVVVGIVAWGLSFGGAATQLQTASADAAGDGVDLANAMVTTVWNAAIAAGGIVGGLLLDRYGAGVFPYAVLALSLLALAVATMARRHGFTPGRRALG
ncbi:MFS transporter [Sphingomonas sp. RIT328]|uniref:MFS transporter n=1 Tax=Sphingomonas sp. RIT328 TaxID=1470591 RepID=UPI000447DF85|nr:MFS transporter [Sphingomonas sp. RIT328]EZP49975.1 Transporter-like membrane protein [Sphingomonas sp. RIT328]